MNNYNEIIITSFCNCHNNNSKYNENQEIFEFRRRKLNYRKFTPYKLLVITSSNI